MAFVSSRIHDDTKWAREAVDEVLERPLFIVPWIFEHTPASSQEVDEGYLEKVRDADLVIWLIETETTDPVRNEITTALQSSLPILMFRTTQGSSDTPTESLITDAGGKYDRVIDADDLKNKLYLAISDEIVRKWRKAGRSTRRAVFSAAKAYSRARCIERWLAAGVPLTIAERFADDAPVGLLKVAPFTSNRFVILRAEMGVGKSLAAERVFLDALVHAEETGGNVPVFLDAKEIAGTIAEHLKTSSLNTVTAGSHVIVIDGLDEAPVERRVALAREARVMTLKNPSLHVLVTCRPLPELSPTFDESCLDLEPLSKEESLALMSEVSEDTVSEHSFVGFPTSFLEAIRRPLFAILVGVTRRNQGVEPLPQGRLLDELVKLSLGRVDAHRESADPLLRKLGRLTVDRGGLAVPTGEIGTYAEVTPLLQSRLVVEREGSLRFPLAILAEWFAARELDEGGILTTDIARDPDRLAHWFVPLQMYVATASPIGASHVLRPLATERPAIAAKVLDESLPGWGSHGEEQLLPSWEQCGLQLREAMTSWVRGLGPVARFIAPIAENRRVRAIGVRRHDQSTLTVSWAIGSDSDRVRQLPDDYGRSPDWLGFTTTFSFATHSGWAWQWAREYLRERLEDLLRKRLLPQAKALNAETAWRIALFALRGGDLWTTQPIPKRDVLDRLLQIRIRASSPSRVRSPDLDKIEEGLESLRTVEGDYICPPWPGPEQRSAPFIWSGYTATDILARTRAVYSAALRAYFELVNRWFPRFKDDLSLASKAPLTMVGVIGKSTSPGGLDYDLALTTISKATWALMRVSWSSSWLMRIRGVLFVRRVFENSRAERSTGLVVLFWISLTWTQQKNLPTSGWMRI